MTRTEFYNRYAAIASTHEGYSGAQLSAVNASVFGEVAVLNANDIRTRPIVDHYFRQAFAALKATEMERLHAAPHDRPAHGGAMS